MNKRRALYFLPALGLATAIILASSLCRPAPPPPLLDGPTPTIAITVMPTATGVVLAGPPTTKTATPTWTPLPEQLPMSTATPVPPTATVEPTDTTVPVTREAVQKG